MASKKKLKFIKRRDGRYAVLSEGKYVNGEDKVKALKDKGLIKLSAKKAAEEKAEDQAGE